VFFSSWLSQLDVALELDEPDELLLVACQLIASGAALVVLLELLLTLVVLVAPEFTTT
jgi:hypothetical protein